MLNYISDFKKELLLINEPVVFTEVSTKKTIIVTAPTLRELYKYEEVMMVVGLMEKDLSEISKLIPGVEIKDHFNFISLVLALGERRQELKDFRDSIVRGLEVIFPPFELKTGLIKFENEMYLDSKLFKLIQDFILESMGREKPIIITEEDDEFTRRQKEAELRVQKIKKSASKKKGESESDESGIDNMIASLLYEFPQFKLNDLFNMNMYTIQYLYKYVGKIANYEVMKIAAGNGLAKKFTYFTE